VGDIPQDEGCARIQQVWKKLPFFLIDEGGAGIILMAGEEQQPLPPTFFRLIFIASRQTEFRQFHFHL
jgi:hypothetical protein